MGKRPRDDAEDAGPAIEGAPTYQRLPLAAAGTTSSVFRKEFTSYSAYDKHKLFVNNYLHYGAGGTDNRKAGLVEAARQANTGKTEVEILREHHRFLRDEEDDEDVSAPTTWEQRLAKKYYDKLFKEFCLADLSRYREGKVAMRWRTQREVIEGKGQFSCANTRCPLLPPRALGTRRPVDHSMPPPPPPAPRPRLKSWEVNFGYMEEGEKRNALVKLRLCDGCGDMLNYKRRKEMRREEKERKRAKRERKRQRREAAMQLVGADMPARAVAADEVGGTSGGQEDGGEDDEEDDGKEGEDSSEDEVVRKEGARSVGEDGRNIDQEMEDFFADLMKEEDDKSTAG
ncbi:hypothetical protein HK101_000320 [Irineochytrium annulatum]|nr:hypothetical protein HK101_000320 [Irineochytrium annulatum]